MARRKEGSGSGLHGARRFWVLGFYMRGEERFWLRGAERFWLHGEERFWLHGEESLWLRGKVLVARRGKVLGARRGKVLLVLVARHEEGSGCGGSCSLYIRVRCYLSCMFLLHATTCFLREKLLRPADGKDGSPMGVVWRGGVYIVCSAEAQWN